MRDRLFSQVAEGIGEIFPLSNAQYTLSAENLKYKPRKYGKRDEYKAITKGQTLFYPLHGDLVLRDAATEDVIDRKTSILAHVPYLTDRGTLIYSGNDYTICLHTSTQIWTEKGMISIGKIVKEKKKIRVWTYNFKKECFELKHITGWYKNYSPEGIGHTKFKNNGAFLPGSTSQPSTLWGTRTHQVVSPTGEKKDLQHATTVTAVRKQLSETQKQVIYGSLLGDATIDQSTGLWACSHSIKQKEYLQLKRDILVP